jgi:uncharacterized phiE125 gp8 family phage protein
MSIRVVEAPTVYLLTRAQAKAQLNVLFDDDDAAIDEAIEEAQDMVEAMTQRRYCPQVLEWVLEGWDNRMVLPLAPGGDSSKATIVSVKYCDQNGVLQTLDPSLYWDRPAGATRAVQRRWFAVWPWVGDGAERVVIRFQITSTPADAAKRALRAMKLLVAHYYAHREAVVGVENRDSSAPLPFGVEENVDAERWNA